jgi:hypothetical protein
MRILHLLAIDQLAHVQRIFALTRLPKMLDTVLGGDVDLVVDSDSGGSSDEGKEEEEEAVDKLKEGLNKAPFKAHSHKAVDKLKEGPQPRRRSTSLQVTETMVSSISSMFRKQHAGEGYYDDEDAANEAETQEIRIRWEDLYIAQGQQRKVPSLFRNLELKGQDTKVPYLRKNSTEEREIMDKLCAKGHRLTFFCRLYWAVVTVGVFAHALAAFTAQGLTFACVVCTGAPRGSA